jgi:hypothetical protein
MLAQIAIGRAQLRERRSDTSLPSTIVNSVTGETINLLHDELDRLFDEVECLVKQLMADRRNNRLGRQRGRDQ